MSNRIHNIICYAVCLVGAVIIFALGEHIIGLIAMGISAFALGLCVGVEAAMRNEQKEG